MKKRLLSVIGVLWVIIIVVYGGHYRYLNSLYSPVTIQQSLEQSINNEIVDFEAHSPVFNQNNKETWLNFCQKKPFRDVVIFEGDSLIFYSNNELIISDKLLFNTDSLGFLKTPNRYIVARPFHVSDSVFTAFHLISIKTDYNIQNAFISNQVLIVPELPSGLALFSYPALNTFPVSVNHQTLFYVSLANASLSQNQFQSLSLGLWVVFLFTLVLLRLLYDYIFKRYYISGLMRIVGFLGDVMILSFLLLHFKWPPLAFKSNFFNESLFVFPGVFPNPGIALFVMTAVTVVVFDLCQLAWPVGKSSARLMRLKGLFASFALIALLFVPYMALKNVIKNGLLNIQNLQGLQFETHEWVTVVFVYLMVLSVLRVSLKILFYLKKVLPKAKFFFGLMAFALVIVFLFTVFINELYVFILLELLFLFLLVWFRNRIALVSWVIIVAAVTTVNYFVVFESLRQQQEKQSMVVLSESLLNQRDKIFEIQIKNTLEVVRADSGFISMVQRLRDGDLSEKSFLSTFQKKYFSYFRDRFEISATLCAPSTLLIVDDLEQPQNCHNFFKNMISLRGEKTLAEDLWYIDSGEPSANYLLTFDLGNDLQIFVDIYKKSRPFALGYPELLVDDDMPRKIDPVYSYAIYRDSLLESNNGDINYPLQLSHLNQREMAQYHHFVFPNDDSVVLVISRHRIGATAYLAIITYSILFGLLGFILLYLLLFLNFNPGFFKKFRTRLQLSLFAIVFLSFVVIGFYVFKNLQSQNDKLHKDHLRDLSHSILIELEHKFAGYDNIRDAEQAFLLEQLIKFSQVFFVDINVFDLDGKLIATSRPQVYQEGIIDSKIAPKPFNTLNNRIYRISIFDECIGDYNFISAYFPIMNYDNKVIAYANLPYFSKQKQLSQEISVWLTTFINIYVLLSLVVFFFIWLISNYVTKPMQTIKNYLAATKGLEHNSKIEVSRNDEIGELVNEYNLMIDKLEASAALLASRERDIAWKEMARQVAHEIKNPLTPMRLSVQHFLRTTRMETEQDRLKLKQFADNLIIQIDNLAEIASTFSDFARMPDIKPEPVDLTRSLNDIIALYSASSEVQIQWNAEKEAYWVLADKKQLDRVFINLFSNSIDAMRSRKHPKIDIVLRDISQEYYEVIIRDNGTGIPEDIQNRIFAPNFTTKGSGAGLGLAIVKNILKGLDGDIRLDKTDEDGSTFVVRLKKYFPNE